MASSQEIQDSDAILAIEARKFIFGLAIAFHRGKQIVVARKRSNYKKICNENRI
tara:strand:+ start:170 stop:331 length:162 start_codon:yes stop_codon:yes gene_type:complete